MDEFAGITFLFVVATVIVLSFGSLFLEYLPESGWECTKWAERSAVDLGERVKTKQEVCIQYTRVGVANVERSSH